MELIVVAVIVLVLVVFVIGAFNRLVTLRQRVKEAWSDIDVILKQRHDELPKLVEVCNSYMTHERETLEALTKARSASQNSTTIDDKAKAENLITGALGRILAVAENYPDLKANQEFLRVQERISALENTIADRREFYNDSVNLYNIRIAQLPDLLVAQQIGYAARPLLEVPQADREDVKLAFANRPQQPRA